jgi:hypothetical protein
MQTAELGEKFLRRALCNVGRARDDGCAAGRGASTAELEIMFRHEKVDVLRDEQWPELLNIQKEQMEALRNLLVSSRTSSDKVSGAPTA